MLFFQGSFLIFLAAVVAATAACGSHGRARLWVFLIASYVFYASWDWRFVFLMLGMTLANYAAARGMPAASLERRRLLLIVSLVVSLGTLSVFKYLDFAIGSFNHLLGLELPLLGIILPVGISFYTFHALSYTIDTYRGNIKPSADLPAFALYISFFPQLVAGPIIRASQFLPQVPGALARPLRSLEAALPLFVFGLFKKVAVADRLAPIADRVFADPAQFSSGDRWLAGLAFAGQIYGDFSGYTDMALALCIAFGFTFPLNFRSPYLALGPRDFWRRWHISLSTWLRDYLYIPLGGSRGGKARTAVALLVTMLLGGLWHGAAWTFVIWGAFHGLLLAGEHLMRLDRLPPWAGVVRWPTFFLLTLLGWMIFRSRSLEQLFAMARGLFSWEPPAAVAAAPVLIGMAFIMAEHLAAEWNRRTGLTARAPWVASLLAGLLLPLALLLRPDTSASFIYFQF